MTPIIQFKFQEQQLLTVVKPNDIFQDYAYETESLLGIIKQLDRSNSEKYDSYSLSPGYFEFTGRNGLGLLANKHSAVVFCQHPNIDNHYLIFPEIANDPDYRLTLELVDVLLSSQISFQFGRFTHEQSQALLAKWKKTYKFRTLSFTEEEVLDWKFPAYVINTSHVMKRSGADFQQLRQRLNKIDCKSIRTKKLDPDKHRKLVENFVVQWANDKDYSMDREHLLSPATKLLDLFSASRDRFSGQILLYKDEFVSYAIWEKPFLNGMPANEFAVASNTAIKGLSELQILSMCEQANEEGIATINVGGSECHGLDRFKRKFCPAQAFNLFSLQLS